MANAQQEIGSAQGQNKAYAKIAKKYTVGTLVRELNGKKRNGTISIPSNPGSGFVEVNFGDDTPIQTKHVGDLKLLKEAPKAAKVEKVKKPALYRFVVSKRAIDNCNRAERLAEKLKPADVVVDRFDAKREGLVSATDNLSDGRLTVQWGNTAAPAEVYVSDVLYTFALKGVTEKMSLPAKTKAEKKQEATRAFAFEDAPLFAKGDRVKSKEFGEGMVVDIKTMRFAHEGTVYVHFDNDKTADGVTGCAPNELKLVKKFKPAKVKQSKVTKKVPNWLHEGTNVAFKDRPHHCIGKIHEELGPQTVMVQCKDEGIQEFARNDLIEFREPRKVRFENVILFGAFVSKERTFVKISKSNGIACEVAGSVTEPIAKLATSDSKLAGSAIQRFKKDDKVLPYVGQ